MKQVRNINLYGWGLGLLLALAACSDEETNLAPQEGNATMTFRLSTRADEEGAALTEQHTHLYVAERLSEHSGIDEDNPMGGTEIPLYCDKDFVIDGNEYSVTNLLGQWYKFAFVCVPDLEEVKGKPFEEMGEKMLFKRYNATEDNINDFNEYHIDYTPVLKYQGNNLRKVSDKDLSVYRKVIDRWAIANSVLTENVLLGRLTGQLVLHMGKLQDQFPTQVDSIVVYLDKVPAWFYVRDNASDSIIYKPSTVGRDVYNVRAVWIPTEEEYKNNEEVTIVLNLLPEQFDSNDVIRVYRSQNDRPDPSHPLQNDEGEPIVIKKNTRTIVRFNGLHPEEFEPIVIKKNTRTIVRFNGLHPEEFEVRYAGFADGNDAVVGVDDDKWNGNQLNKGDN